MSFLKVTSEKITLGDIEPGQSLELSKQISHEMYNDVIDNFKSEGRPPWQPLKKSTRKQRLRMGFGERPILDRKMGRLGLKEGIQRASTHETAAVGTRQGIMYDKAMHYGAEITRYPYSSTVRLRTDKSGKLKKQKNHGNLAIFAKGKHKLAKTVRYSVKKAYTIKIPARPFLQMSSNGYRKILGVVKRIVKT